jgi:Sugar (and other) transporter
VLLCSDINAGFQERSHNPLATRFALPVQQGHSIEASIIILVVMTKVGGTAPGIVVAAFLFMFNTFFAVGWLGMTWLYPAEIVPLRIRAPANALSTSANWAFNFMVVMITPVSFSSVAYKTYVIFAVMYAQCLYILV